MKLNKNLAKTFMVTKKYNETAYDFVKNMLSYAPSIENALKYATSPVLYYEEVGQLHGTDGNWKLIIHLDNKGSVEGINVSFTEYPSSNSESKDTYSFSIHAFDENSRLFSNLVIAEKTRVNNYRFMLPKAVKLTATDVAKLSRPEVLSRTSLSYSGAHSLIKTNSKTVNGSLETLEHSYPYNIVAEDSSVSSSLDSMPVDDYVLI